MKFLSLEQTKKLLEKDGFNIKNVPKTIDRVLIISKPIYSGSSYQVGFVSAGIYKFTSLSEKVHHRIIHEWAVS
jgi:hypothetical protein